MLSVYVRNLVTNGLIYVVSNFLYSHAGEILDYMKENLSESLPILAEDIDGEGFSIYQLNTIMCVCDYHVPTC